MPSSYDTPNSAELERSPSESYDEAYESLLPGEREVIDRYGKDFKLATLKFIADGKINKDSRADSAKAAARFGGFKTVDDIRAFLSDGVERIIANQPERPKAVKQEVRLDSAAALFNRLGENPSIQTVSDALFERYAQDGKKMEKAKMIFDQAISPYMGAGDKAVRPPAGKYREILEAIVKQVG